MGASEIFRLAVQVTGVSLFLLGLVVYARLLWRAYVKADPQLLALFQAHVAHNLGLPVAGLTAFSLVVTLEVAAGTIKVDAWGLKFEGAAGQLLFWILCFLAIVSAMKALKA